MNLLLLILSLPTENATVRMRAWRALKTCGAAVLRDGIYIMPELELSRATLNSIAADVTAGGGTAYVLQSRQPDGEDFTPCFDRSQEYATLLSEIVNVSDKLHAQTVTELLKPIRKLRKTFAAVAEIDFFPGQSQQQTDTALSDLEKAAARLLSPDEPHASNNEDISRLLISDYQGRIWATRQRPWVDRLASAWLIRRFIDPNAKIVWLSSPDKCPNSAMGFDFDGATFSHVGTRVTFEVLLASFGIEQPALKKIAALVHYLDVGGVQTPEAIGIESVLSGMRNTISDDNQFLATASTVFDGLLCAFEMESGGASNE